MSKHWELAGLARTGFADMIEPLTPAQLAEQSLCTEWDARGVLAHVTSLVETGAGGMIATMFRTRFDFDKVSVYMVNQRSERSADDLLRSLRVHSSETAPLPGFPEEFTVSDVAIHTQDVRRPLQLAGQLDPTVLRTALDFLTTHKHANTLVNRRPLDAVRFQATDLDWAWGQGATISGTAEALMMAIANRPVLHELEGPGTAIWAEVERTAS